MEHGECLLNNRVQHLEKGVPRGFCSASLFLILLFIARRAGFPFLRCQTHPHLSMRSEHNRCVEAGVLAQDTVKKTPSNFKNNNKAA